MSERQITADERCKKSVSDHTGYHWSPCNKPAKFRVSVADGPAKPYCGIHTNQLKSRPGAVVVPL